MVTEQDKAKMRRIGLDLADGESNDRGGHGQREQILATINADRAKRGAEPLLDRAPEEGLYDRAKSLGMARIDR